MTTTRGGGEPDAMTGDRPTDVDVDVVALQRRTLRVVVASQVCGGAGLAAGATVGALLAREMLGGDGAAGVPTALFTLGSAITAFLVGRVTQRAGRRTGLAAGFGAGALGAVGVVSAAALDSVVLLLPSLLVYGAGTATNLQARYAGTDLAAPARRATAVSIAMVSTTVGAVAGPNLVAPMGAFARSVGVPALAGPFMLGAVAYATAGMVLFVLLRPDPFLVARDRLERSDPPVADPPVAKPSAAEPSDAGGSQVRSGSERSGSEQSGSEQSVDPRVYLGAAVMIATQTAMVAIMTMTPVHMREHGHGLGDVGLVIGFHIGAMYLPSLVTGVLVDQVGRVPMAVAAAVTLLVAGITAASVPPDSLAWLVLALVLLGLGWNFGLISGTALIVDSTDPAHRPRVQGTVDVGVALAGAGGGVLSGVVVSATSYGTLSLLGGVLSLAVIPVFIWARRVGVHPAT